MALWSYFSVIYWTKRLKHTFFFIQHGYMKSTTPVCHWPVCGGSGPIEGPAPWTSPARRWRSSSPLRPCPTRPPWSRAVSGRPDWSSSTLGGREAGLFAWKPKLASDPGSGRRSRLTLPHRPAGIQAQALPAKTSRTVNKVILELRFYNAHVKPIWTSWSCNFFKKKPVFYKCFNYFYSELF